MTDQILEEARRLSAIGIACHWLRPKSKAPIASQWSTKAKEPWAELEASYAKGYNVGVRLGRPSMVGFEYLAVVDCDCKSSDPKHRAEMEACVRSAFPSLPNDTPRVTTGRGNGSGHIYVLSPEPAASRRVSQSSETVKVHMPSAGKPSRRELTELTAEEINGGWRLRPAWEVSLMGEGRQVVAPPSIHPDTGKAYEWGFPLVDGDQIPSIALAAKEEMASVGNGTRPELQRNGDFTPVPIDWVGDNGLSHRIVDMILSGTGVEDRSAALMACALAMAKARWTLDQALTGLTDPDTYLGPTAFDHAKTKSRGKAAKWLYDFTVAKAYEQAAAARHFDAVVEVSDAVETPELSPEQQAEQDAWLAEADNWETKIERDKAGFKALPTLWNALHILNGYFEGKLFKKNIFSGQQLHAVDTDWAKKDDAVTDEHVARILQWFTNRYRFEPGKDKVFDAITALAARHTFHPVREYLASLPPWDGRERLSTWMRDYLQASGPEPYLSEVSRKLPVAMIARVMEPGCKYDQVVILEGKQGIGKSTVLQRLAHPWFTDAPINVNDKDGVLNMRNKWLAELGELSSLRRSDANATKEFVSRPVDTIRSPYGRKSEDFPRQCVFVGTTNQQEYLRDSTGNRRFWPVVVGRCDFDRVSKDRDQLFAEALIYYEFNEPLYLEKAEAESQALGEQAARNESDLWQERIQAYVNEQVTQGKFKGYISLGDMFSDGGPFKNHRDSKNEQMRCADALRILGWERVQRWVDSRNHWVWEPACP